MVSHLLFKKPLAVKKSGVRMSPHTVLNVSKISLEDLPLSVFEKLELQTQLYHLTLLSP